MVDVLQGWLVEAERQHGKVDELEKWKK